MFRIFLLIVFLFLIDIYAFQAIKHVFKSGNWISLKQASIIFWSVASICYLILFSSQIYEVQHWSKFVRTYAFAFVFICYLSKIFVVLFLVIDDLWRLIQWAYTYISNTGKTNQPNSNATQISRSDFLNKAALIAAAIPFISLIYGMVKGAYNFTIHNVKIPVAGLPDVFDGYKIVQISDIHAGSFTVTHPINQAVDLIQKQGADVILFTGDLVNNLAEEVEPFLNVFNKLQAKHGVFSILGNHDYGDYVSWESAAEKQENMNRLKSYHHKMGWQLLLDDFTYIENGGHQIGLIGVQNWSTHLRFPKYGNMQKATSNFKPTAFNILLSHDPSHWQGEILSKYPFINLTLSGHTHGFQFGIEVPGIKWSPVQYVYKQWAGLYNKGHQYLYVNRGFGFLGYPGRVGISPEITVIELKKA